ncbi:MAG: hypothetical protein CMN84_11340 [Spongiibacteraceae bacterium]|nr:hypothetical protein [Spongiibacteraceae bacterium]|tara:strand:+ start:427 stop:867 length:441 start_codon:yes stop_codon:yes gene_type:complete
MGKNHYLGGSTILHCSPKIGVKNSSERLSRKIKAMHGKGRTQDYLDEVGSKEKELRKIRRDLKTIRVSSQDKNDIGMYSSGWKNFLASIKGQFDRSKDAGLTRADDVAKFWNETGFKTASGEKWTPRLVNIAKDKIGIKHGSKIIW